MEEISKELTIKYITNPLVVIILILAIISIILKYSKKSNKRYK